MPYLLAMVVAALIAAVATPPVRFLAQRLGAMDPPDARRPHKIHRVPTPLLGGLPIYGAVLFGVLVAPERHPAVWALMVPATLSFALGAADDIRPLPSWLLIGGRVGVVFLAVFMGLRPTVFGPAWVNAGVAVFWLGLVHIAFNTVDNTDGAATGLALVSCLVLFAAGLVAHDLVLAAMAAIVGGACLGFIGFNMSPGYIFLGDGGAFFLGFMVAGLGIIGPWQQPPLGGQLVAPVLAAAVPVLNAVLEAARLPGGLTHLHLRRQHRPATILGCEYGAALVAALAAGLALGLPGWAAPPLLLIVVGVLLVYARSVLRPRGAA
jgi:UDP-GlcNAc:undecaprenyl-phosphate GlcNAc-1-phosphate transferase